MLKNLSIINAAVAKNVSVDFENAFTVITGETGSGKSVMIDCLQIISGAKASRDIVRNGEPKAVISAIFDCDDEVNSRLEDVGLEADENGEIMIQRTITADGKTTVRLNGRTITIAQLKTIGSVFIGINTQDEKNFLSDRNEYYGVLDSFADNESVVSEYRDSYRKLTAAQNELSSLREDLKEKSMMIDILTYQIKEIDSARLTSDDEEDKLLRLKTKIKSIERTEKSRKIVNKALAQNDKGYSAAYLLERASLALSQVSDVVEGAADMIRRLDEYRYDIIDIAETVNVALDSGIDGDPSEKLDQIETRLHQIDRLKRKYGNTIAEIKEFRADAASKLKKFTESDDEISYLEKRIVKQMQLTKECANRLHESRVSAASKLSSEILTTLKYLDMPKVKFVIEVLPDIENGEYRFTSNGADVVDFMISVNPGEPPMTISKVASGGEMSRVMLALRSAINRKTGAGTVVFDEIDAGVSGSTSERIGLLMKQLSENLQVISITHSPQIASIADYHYLIQKYEIDGRAESSVKVLEHSERIDEIARIIGGINVTDKQKAAAREMLTKDYNVSI